MASFRERGGSLVGVPGKYGTRLKKDIDDENSTVISATSISFSNSGSSRDFIDSSSATSGRYLELFNTSASVNFTAIGTRSTSTSGNTSCGVIWCDCVFAAGSARATGCIPAGVSSAGAFAAFEAVVFAVARSAGEARFSYSQR